MKEEVREKGRAGVLRVTALILSVAALLFCIPYTSFSDTLLVTGKKGSDFCTNSFVAGQLQKIFDMTVYSSTPYFTTFGTKTCGNSACTDCALPNVLAEHPAIRNEGISISSSVYGSGAFARFAFYMIFGISPSAINPFGNATADLKTVGRVASGSMAIIGDYESMTASNLKAALKRGTPGDILQTRSSSGANHTMIFLAADDNGVTVLHSVDFTGSSYAPNRVLISEYSYSGMISTWNQVISLLRAEDDVYAAAWSKGETHTDHVFTDAGQNFCTVCGVMVSPELDVSKAGVFKATRTCYSYKGYYRSTGTAGGSFSSGKYVESVGTVINSTGVPFYKLTDGSYVSGEDFVKDTTNTPTITMSAGDYPTGTLTVGQSFNLKGDVEQYSPKLNYMTGYIIGEDGVIVSKKEQPVSYAVVHVKDCDINTGLKFSTLVEGRYAYLLTARNTEGRMSSFCSTFEVKAPGVKPVAPTPSAPTLSSKSDTTVTLKSVSGCEYRRGENGSWQKSSSFTGLTPNTAYTFYCRTAETSSYQASAASAPLTVTTDKRVQTAPSAPVLSTKTTTTVTLAAQSGYEYRCGDGSWQKSAVFTGLTPNRTYTFYCRLAANDYSDPSPASPGLKVTTDRAMQSTPAAPTLSAKTSTGVTLNAVSGCEYRVGSGSWQSSPVFSGLEPNTTYSFYCRKAATGEYSASDASAALNVTTDRGVGRDPVGVEIKSVTSTTVELVAVDGFEYRYEGGSWQKSPLFTGLKPATTYKFYQRFAETAQYTVGSSSGAKIVVTDKATPSAPSAPELAQRGDDSITLKAVDGVEYSRDGGKTWQSSPTFTGLTPNTGYSFFCRYTATSDAYASEVSAPLNAKTDRTHPPVPAAPELLSVDGASKTVKVVVVSGCEYTSDGKTWNTDGVFTFDSYGTKSIYCRVAVSDRTYASGKSQALTVRVLPVSVTSTKYAVSQSDRVVSGVSAGTTLAQLRDGFAEKEYLSFVDRDGKTPEDGALAATGMKIRLPGGEEYLLTVRGDVSGDGRINVFDLAALRGEILEPGLNSVFRLAADVDGDGDVDVFDLVRMRNTILEGGAL